MRYFWFNDFLFILAATQWTILAVAACQLFLVIMPQAVRIAIPPTVGFLVQLVKATAVASIIGFVELTRAGQLMTNATFQPMMIVYPIVAGLYFALCWPLSVWSQYLEKRLRVENIIGRKLEKANEQV